jgi:hypothetical protein
MNGRSAPLPPEFQHRAFLAADALNAGVPKARLEAADLVAPTSGVRMPRDLAATLVERIRAIHLVIRDDQRIGCVSALALYGCPLPRRFERADRDVHVVTAGKGPITRRRGIAGHRASDRDEARIVEGLRVSRPAAAWFEARSDLTVEELVIVGDYLVGPSGLATPDDLRGAIWAGSIDVHIARTAVAKVRVGSESAMESRFRLIVLEAGFPEPEVNLEIRDARGSFLGRVDLAWPNERIGLEYDGAHHRIDRQTWENDRHRSNGFSVSQWTIVHATAKDATDPSAVLDRLRHAFAARVPWIRSAEWTDTVSGECVPEGVPDREYERLFEAQVIESGDDTRIPF